MTPEEKRKGFAKGGRWRWSVREEKKHGTSFGGVRADNYFDAVKRARQIGFKNPDAVVFDHDGKIFEAWRKRK